MALFEENDTHIIFLAMFWGGGGPFTIPQIIYMYDFINRAIPSRLEMQNSLNILLDMGLIEKNNDTYIIPKKYLIDFKSFKEKTKKDKFDTVIMYFNKLAMPRDIPGTVKMTERQYESFIKEYRKSFKNILLNE